MKKFKNIIFGIVIGTLAFTAFVIGEHLVSEYSHNSYRAVADAIENDPFFNSALYDQIKSESSGKLPLIPISAHGNIFDDLFASDYENLYALMFFSGAVSPENDALVELARGYNITPLEAQDIMSGSITPVYNLLPFRGDNLTQHEILYTASQFKREFEDLYEIYQLKQELGSSAYLSEVFSNGDLSDSGFDLVHDLEQIETILFDVVDPVSSVDLGGRIDTADEQGMKESPYHSRTSDDHEPSFSSVYFALSLNETDEETDDDDLDSFDPSSLVEYLDEDVCPKDDEDESLSNALSVYEEKADQYFQENPDAKGTTSGQAVPDEQKALEEELVPEKPADFRRKEQCDGLLLFGRDASNPAMLEGGTQTDTQTSSGIPIASVEFYLCLEYNEKWELYTSYIPTAPCFSCEFEKILAYIKKTLSSSLVPNKLTGNLMEASLCKQKLLDVANIDVNFNIIWAPVEAPANDDAIYGKSIFGEWSKFIKKNHPFLLEFEDKSGSKPIGYSLLPENVTRMSEEWVEQNRTDTSSVQEVLSEVIAMREYLTSEAAESVERYQITTKAEDFSIYSQGVMAEVGQMKEYFKAFSNHFQKIAEEEGFCRSIQTKKTCE